MEKINRPPETQAEIDLVMSAVMAELQSQLFLFIPQHAAKYYEQHDMVPNDVKQSFPDSSVELQTAGTCFAVGLYTACVFHSMRAAEVGVRLLAGDLAKIDGVKIEFKAPIEFQEWGVIQDRIDSAIKNLKQRPRGHDREKDQRFFSEAAAQFRYFNDGWRVRAAHSREPFSEQQALTILDHTREFFVTLAERLSE